MSNHVLEIKNGKIIYSNSVVKDTEGREELLDILKKIESSDFAKIFFIKNDVADFYIFLVVF